MAIKMISGFDIEATEPVDSRIVLTKAQMAAVDVDVFPDVYFAFCPDDDSWYKFVYDDSKAPIDCFTKISGTSAIIDVTGGMPTGTLKYDALYRVNNDKLYTVRNIEGYDIPNGIPRISSDSAKNLMDANIDANEINVAAIKRVDNESDIPDTTVPGTIFAIGNETNRRFKIYQDNTLYSLDMSWQGTLAEYNALTYHNPAITYYIVD